MKKRVFLSTMIVAGATMLSRILGFVRDAVMAYFFGAGAALDGFIVAFRIPNLLRRFVAEGTLTICFVPVYTEYLEKKGPAEALKLAQKTFSFLIVVLVAITSLGILFSPQLVSLFGYGFTDPEIIKSTIQLNRIMFPYIFFVSIVAFCMGYLNSHHSFFAPAISPVLLNVGMIFGVVVLSRFFENGLWGLAFGVLLGGCMQLILQIPYMIKHGFKMHISFDFKHPGIRKIGFMVLPAMMSGAVSQVNLLINTILASMLPGGSVSYLYYSDRLTEIVMGVFVLSIANVTLPELSRHAARNELPELRIAFRNAVTSSLFFAIPASVALMVCGREIVEVLFMRGEFGELSADNTYKALFFASMGLFSLTIYKLLIPMYYSLKDTRTPFITALIALSINAVTGYFLMQTSLVHAGLAVSSVISIMVQMVLLLYLLRRKISGVDLKKTVIPVIKLLCASTVMGAVLFILRDYFIWGATVSFMVKLFQLITLVVAGGAVYMISCYLLRVHELNFVIAAVVKKAGRRRR
ncbi:MAG: murein biosynthesis integral membrane protein MurJ [Spirochaetes bacterium]|jgi:putative peptidoglycan lipid II flippase|nr:murein biosynthesis integral membrane protein MurJ [Spirochaetota bacterium]